MNKTAMLDFLNEQLSRTEIPAGEVGFLASRLFRMVIAGDAKLPLDNVEEVAAGLGCDPHHLFRLAMQQFYDEEAMRLLDRMFVARLTVEEQKWLHEIRSAAAGPVAEPGLMAKRLLRSLVKRQVAG